MFTIKIREVIRSDYECYRFYAVDAKDEAIFGALAEVFRSTSAMTGEFNPFEIIYESYGKGTYEEKLPYVAVINEAMKKLKELEKNNE